MSHYSVYKTKVGNVNTELVKQAIRSLAREIGAEITNKVVTATGSAHSVLIGLKTNKLPNGIGFGVRNGVLTIHGDMYGQELEFRRISQLAQNYVKAYKVAQTARATYPTANIQISTRQKEVILEVVV